MSVSCLLRANRGLASCAGVWYNGGNIPRMANVRSRRFIEELPKHNNVVYKAAIAAGYSEKYALKQGKKIFTTAMHEQGKELMAATDTSKGQALSTLEKVGITKERLRERIAELALQDDERNVALKVLTALAREDDIELGDSGQSKVTVPILNLTVKEGATRPQIESVSDNIDCATRSESEGEERDTPQG